MYKILLVEDDKNIREMVVEYFSRKGDGKFPVSVAPNGEIGLQMAYENPYDLLLLDVNLPKMDGFSICKEVRRYSDVPIMFITARQTSCFFCSAYTRQKPYIIYIFLPCTRVMSRSDGRKTAQEPPFSPTEHNMTKANFKFFKKVRNGGIVKWQNLHNFKTPVYSAQ